MNRNDLMDVDLAVMDFMRDHPDAPMAQIIRAAVETAEPLIRGDERARQQIHLRAQVEALPEQLPPVRGELILRADVLALFDGSVR